MSSRLDFIKLVNAEYEQCRTGVFKNYDDSTCESYQAQYRDWNSRLAEALIVQKNNKTCNSPFHLRMLLNRGNLHEAQLCLDVVEKDIQSGDTLLNAEILVEKARLQGMNGNWKECQDLTSVALQFCQANVSQLALHQMRALALYELGDFKSARLDLEISKSLSQLMPHATSSFYSDILILKIDLHDHCNKKNDELVNRYFINKIKSTLNLDQLLTLLRLSIDVKRKNLIEHSRFALACYYLADTIGDQLYASLALVDLYYSLPIERRDSIESYFLKAREQFPRVKNLVSEIESEKQVKNTKYTTANSIRTFEQSFKRSDSNISQNSEIDLLKPINYLIYPDCALICRLRPWHYYFVPQNTQFFKAFRALANGPISKQMFFKKIWGDQKYSADLHDHLIWNLLSKMKKKFGVPIKIEKGIVTITDSLII